MEKLQARVSKLENVLLKLADQFKLASELVYSSLEETQDEFPCEFTHV